jgi:hypothetical protein
MSFNNRTTRIDYRIPMAVLLALLLQAATAVWWAATKDSDDRFHRHRIDRLEQDVQQTKEVDAQVLQRLARIEEHLNGEAAALERIERRMNGR